MTRPAGHMRHGYGFHRGAGGGVGYLGVEFIMMMVTKEGMSGTVRRFRPTICTLFAICGGDLGDVCRTVPVLYLRPASILLSILSQTCSAMYLTHWQGLSRDIVCPRVPPAARPFHCFCRRPCPLYTRQPRFSHGRMLPFAENLCVPHQYAYHILVISRARKRRAQDAVTLL
jgi:hypothetical protein